MNVMCIFICSVDSVNITLYEDAIFIVCDGRFDLFYFWLRALLAYF